MFTTQSSELPHTDPGYRNARYNNWNLLLFLPVYLVLISCSLSYKAYTVSMIEDCRTMDNFIY